jgi:hypothetical protein
VGDDRPDRPVDVVSYAKCVRFAESSIFEQLFVQVLAQCREAGLLDGTRLVVEATHVEANAALQSLRAELAVVAEIQLLMAAAAKDPRAATHLAATADNRAYDSDPRPLAARLGLRPHLAAIARRLQPTSLSADVAR